MENEFDLFTNFFGLNLIKDSSSSMDMKKFSDSLWSKRTCYIFFVYIGQLKRTVEHDAKYGTITRNCWQKAMSHVNQAFKDEIFVVCKIRSTK